MKFIIKISLFLEMLYTNNLSINFLEVKNVKLLTDDARRTTTDEEQLQWLTETFSPHIVGIAAGEYNNTRIIYILLYINSQLKQLLRVPDMIHLYNTNFLLLTQFHVPVS